MNMSKFLIIGLDGATWDVIRPLINQGELKTIAKLVKEGASGNLNSVIPPITGAAWVSIATGKDAGKKGIYDFLIGQDYDYKLRPVNSKDFFRDTIWNYLAKFNIPSVIQNYPMYFPPIAPEGCNIISGLGSSVDENLTNPLSLKEELDKVTGGYEITVSYMDTRYDNKDVFLTDLMRVAKKRLEAALYLIKNKPWELFFVVFSETDWLQHVMWQDWSSIDSIHHREFIMFWREIDKHIERLIDACDGNTNILLISDHGFGPQTCCFNLSGWLEQGGYLVRKKGATQIVPKFINWAEQKIAFSDLARQIRQLPILKNVSKTIITFLPNNEAKSIDFIKSQAFNLGHTIVFGGIYLNSQFQGEIKKVPQKEKENLIVDIKNNLEQTCRQAGHDIDFYEPRIIYDEAIGIAPDIIFSIDDWACVISNKSSKDPLFIETQYTSRHSGTHRMNGILLAWGPDIISTQIKDAGLCDIVPTVIANFRLPIPSELDGQVLPIFRQEVLRSVKVVSSIPKVESHVGGLTSPSEEEERRIEERLRDLGYL